ncbi:hypothetical protein GCM10009767_06790 [Kocuria aegyptia]|uniref:DUF2530 domain-containing protein n=1 Tax=Kocuria aegyptia TaxID=330943 RepID=A0ABN2K8J1_9MICC
MGVPLRRRGDLPDRHPLRPWAVEPPGDIIGLYDPPLIGWLAFGWLLALIAVLIASTIYEVRLWLQHRSLEHD